MRLNPGAKLGWYEIIGPLGEGGMGEVYRARDSRLHRDVAVKIVHPDLTGTDPLLRFRREARVLASLSHPNVANVYEFDELPEAAFIVMELVPGETLASRLERGPMPVAETLRVAGQVAAALQAVHEQGIIHRDLKPANIKITGDGVVKVLDFGLAKHTEAAAQTRIDTMTADNTHAGAVLGTAAYMSPEQARGLEVDRRTDVWAFGCVLFEMLTGARAFGATTHADTIAAVLDRELDWSTLPASTPPSIARLLRRCLTRDPRRRLRDIGDAQLELEDAIAEREQVRPKPVTDDRPRTRRGWFAAAVFAIGLLIGAAATWLGRAPTVSPGNAVRFVVSLPSTAQLAGLDFPSLAISPDGSTLAFVASRGSQTQLFVRPLNGLESKPLPGTTNAVAPFFSPDGRWIAFFSGGELKKVALSGGMPVTLCEAPVGLGGSWNQDDVILFAATTGSGISQVSAFGGRPQRISTLDVAKGEFSHRWPEWLPGARTILYTVGTVGSWNDAQIVAQSVATGERSVIVQGGSNPRYLASGHLLYVRNGVIMSVPFDAGSVTATGTAVPLLEGVLQSSDGAAQFSISPNGHAAYVEGAFGSEERRLVMVGRDGVVTPLSAPPHPYQWPRVSPDGQKVLVTIEGSPPDLWVYDLRSSSVTQLTFDAGANFGAWARDGQRVVFTSAKSGPPNLFVTAITQPAPSERIAASDHMQIAGSWSADGGTLAFVERRPNTGRDILLVSPRDNRPPQPWLASPHDESTPRMSPDGRWLAYVSNQSGHDEVYVRSVASAEQVYPISTGGGAEPVWGTNAQELFYRNPDGMMIAVVDGSPTRAPRTRLLFKGEFAGGTIDSSNYDVMPDGQRFIMIQRQSHAPTTLHVLMNWAAGKL
jgi:serine/threonine protein kinase/Tol biopolymer transport system component